MEEHGKPLFCQIGMFQHKDLKENKNLLTLFRRMRLSRVFEKYILIY
jgi:hypothetical protein